MSIFKRKYKDKQGRQRTAKTYSVRFKDHFGVYHIIAGFPSKRATETLNTRVHDLVSCKIAGANPDKEMEKWLFELPEPILKNFVNYGLIDGTRVSNAVSIEHHINDFEQYLKDKGCTHRHIITTVPRIEKIFQKSGIKNLNNIKSEALSRLVADLPLSEQTRKHYVRNLKQFSKWLFETNKTNKDILKNMQVPKVNDTVRNRRPLTVDEVSSLLRATRNSDYIFRGVDSYERYLIYRVAIETGMRANEIRTLIVSDLDFENYQVNIRAKNEKSRRGASLPLEESVMLQAELDKS